MGFIDGIRRVRLIGILFGIIFRLFFGVIRLNVLVSVLGVRLGLLRICSIFIFLVM